MTPPPLLLLLLRGGMNHFASCRQAGRQARSTPDLCAWPPPSRGAGHLAPMLNRSTGV